MQKNSSKKLRVGIIFGGRSGEHDVSLMSAESIINAIDRDKYEPVLIGISRTGRWLVSGDPLKTLKSGNEDETTAVALVSNASNYELVSLEKGDKEIFPGKERPFDVVFPVLHGTFGEDGTIQGMLELAGVPYVGAGVAASSVGLDKDLMKSVFIAHGLPVVKHLVFRRTKWVNRKEDIIVKIDKEIGYPCFTKPANAGSSVGITKVKCLDELTAALEEAFSYDRKAVVEKGIDAREIECSVLGNDDPVASVLGEIVPKREFYDYEAKYFDEDSELIIPAGISEEKTKTMQELAIKVYKSVDCSGMARVDFMIDKNNDEIYVNELNTIPGFTRISMYPKLFKASGISYKELISRLIELALERFNEKEKSKTTFLRNS